MKALLDNLLFHPQRLRARRMLFQIHLWMGILLALYLTVIGVTGSLLVFENEWTDLAMQPVVQAMQETQMQSSTCSAAEALRSAQSDAPSSKLFYLALPTSQRPYYVAYRTSASNQQSVLRLSARTCAPLKLKSRLWIEWVHDLHIQLLLGDSGIMWNSIGAALLLTMALSGIALWWAGIARWTSRLKIHLRSGWRRINFDVHNAVGFWTLLFVLWWSISSIYFAWPGIVTSLVQKFSALTQMQATAPPPQAKNLSAQPAPLDFLVQSAQQATPQGFVSGVSLPGEKGGSYTIFVDRFREGDLLHRDIHTFAANGQLLNTWKYGENHTAGDWLLWAMYPLHTGILGGIWTRILWMLVGLCLPVLSISGLWMYWNRALRVRLRSALR